MKIEVEYVLCGGTYLYTVLAAIRKIAKRRGQNNGGIKETTCFLDLIKIPEYESRYKLSEEDISTVISKYKNCTLEAPEWMMIRDKEYIKNFDSLIRSDYASLLHSTIIWADKYLDLQKNGDWLCHALLELVYYDDSISNDTLLFAKVDGTQISINDLLNSEEIHVQALLLGLWHYVIVSEIENKKGQITLDSITDKSGKSKSVRKLQDFYGKMIHKDFTARILKLEKVVPKKNGEGVKVQNIFPFLEDDEDVEDKRDILPGKNELLGLSDNEIALPDQKYAPFLESQYSAYKKVKTLLFHNEPRDFKSIYLCNDVERPNYIGSFIHSMFDESRGFSNDNVVENFTYEKMLDFNNRYLIITGMGGLGKSMMMRHLLIDAIENYADYRMLPLFVPLKDYKNDYASIVDFFYEIFDLYSDGVNKEYFIELLGSGRVILLLDGLDEVKEKYRSEFDVALERFVNKYRNNYFIMSSRPNSNFIGFSRFTKTKLLPFTKEQSLALIQKLDLGKSEENIKQGFLSELDKTLYNTHKEFVQNPLLLTIMLLTYKQKTNIPNEMHKFYEKAYETLFSEHDNIKIGYERKYKTKLKQDKFAEYFAEFCFISYQEDNFDPSEDDCRRYFEEMDLDESDRERIYWKDFLDDLVDCVCLIYEEGQRYHFIHRSIQEYFCARYFYMQPDSFLPEIGEFFEDGHTKKGDKTFDMLYAMKSNSVGEMVFIPFLKKVFEVEDERIHPNYEKFLLMVYPYLNFDVGDTLWGEETEPRSYLYKFIAEKQGYLSSPLDFEYPCMDDYEEFLSAEYVRYDDDFRIEREEDSYEEAIHGLGEELINKEDLPEDYLKHFDMPETVGWSYEISLEDVFNDEYDYTEIIEFLFSDNCPLKAEFDNMYKYYLSLLERKNDKKESLHDKLKRKKKSM